MDWIAEMRAGMEMMQEACRKNTEWNKCSECPFDEYCTILMEQSVKDGHDYDTYSPENWIETEMESKI